MPNNTKKGKRLAWAGKATTNADEKSKGGRKQEKEVGEKKTLGKEKNEKKEKGLLVFRYGKKEGQQINLGKVKEKKKEKRGSTATISNTKRKRMEG